MHCCWEEQPQAGRPQTHCSDAQPTSATLALPCGSNATPAVRGVRVKQETDHPASLVPCHECGWSLRRTAACTQRTSRRTQPQRQAYRGTKSESERASVVGAAGSAARGARDIGDRRPRVRYDREQLRRRPQLDAGVEVPAAGRDTAENGSSNRRRQIGHLSKGGIRLNVQAGLGPGPSAELQPCSGQATYHDAAERET